MEEWKSMKTEISKKIDEALIDLENPDWIIAAGKSYIKIKVEDWSGVHDLKITINDVVNYYAKDARNISSGCRKIGMWASDWRSVDSIAELALQYFKKVNLKDLQKASRAVGIVLKT
jgi:hypothetical protein